MTDAQRKQRVAAGRASAAASRKLLGEEAYILKMQRMSKVGGLNGKGGRPTWQQSLAKAKERMGLS